MISLYELSNRMEITAGASLDAVRNLILILGAFCSVLALAGVNNFKIPNLLQIWPYLLFALWASLSILWADSKSYGIREGLKLIYPILVYLLARISLRKSSGKSLYLAIHVCLTIFCILSIIIASLIVLSELQKGSWVWGSSRLLKFPLAVTEPLAVTFILFEIAAWRKLPKWRIQWWLVCAMIIYVLLSLTRSYIIALVFGIVIIFWSTWRNWFWKLIIVAGGIVTVLLILTVDNPIKSRMFWRPQEITISSLATYTLTNPGILLSDDFIKTSGRFVYWNYLLERARDHHPAILGAGIGSSRPIMRISRFNAEVAHSDFVTYLAELGYIGFSLFILMYGATLFWSLRKVDSRYLSPTGQASALSVLALLTFAIIGGLVYNVFWVSQSFLMIAIILIAIVQSEVKTTKPPMQPLGTNNS